MWSTQSGSRCRKRCALMRTVLESGVSYADACTDSETLQAIFDSDYLDALAGYRAVGAVPGLGASPGLTNALTSYLGQRLERIDEARFYLVDDLSLRSESQWRERLAEFGSVALVWQDSDWHATGPHVGLCCDFFSSASGRGLLQHRRHRSCHLARQLWLSGPRLKPPGLQGCRSLGSHPKPRFITGWPVRNPWRHPWVP